MSNTKKAGRGRTVKARSGTRVPLVSDIPGGQAYWYAPAELSPRRSQEYELIAVEMAGVIEEAVDARALTPEGGPTTVFAGFGGGARKLTRAELRAFIEMTEAATWAYLKSWTLTDGDGEPLPLPVDPDSVKDLPRDVYEALNAHGAKLMAAAEPGGGFTVDSLPDDLDEADEDLPTSA